MNATGVKRVDGSERNPSNETLDAGTKVIVSRRWGNPFVMEVRLTLLAVTLLSFTSFAGEGAPKNAVGEPPPREIIVVDDVGVGDHFPSHVPGAGKYRLPEPEVAPRPQPAPQVAAPAAGPAPVGAVSDPAEWAAPPASPVTPSAPPPVQQPAPAQTHQAVAARPPSPAATAAVASAVTPDLERETLLRASDALLSGSCESELPRLAELLERTESAGIKARGRILRARCFAQRSKALQAKAEYQTYLKDFPEGLWVDEARAAVRAD